MSEMVSVNPLIGKLLNECGLSGLDSRTARLFTLDGWSGNCAVIPVGNGVEAAIERDTPNKVSFVVRQGEPGNRFSVNFAREESGGAVGWQAKTSILENTKVGLGRVLPDLAKQVATVAQVTRHRPEEIEMTTTIGHTGATSSGETSYYSLRFVALPRLDNLGEASRTQVVNQDMGEVLKRLGVKPSAPTDTLKALGVSSGNAGLSALLGLGQQQTTGLESIFGQPTTSRPTADTVARLLLEQDTVLSTIFEAHLSRAELLGITKPFDPKTFLESKLISKI